MKSQESLICKACDGQGWVCEIHLTPNWETCPLCEVHCGIPCKECNPNNEDGEPTKSGFKDIYFNKNGVNQ